jgi:hypothetical protein
MKMWLEACLFPSLASPEDLGRRFGWKVTVVGIVIVSAEIG